MKMFKFAICIVVAVFPMLLARAGDKPEMIQNPQMIVCNQQAGNRTGEDRQNYIAACLQGDDSNSAPAGNDQAQQQKIAACNQQAEGKRGKERKAFLSACLK